MQIISIIGLGNVGTTLLYSFINKGLELHINVLEPRKEAEGKLLDIQHALPLCPNIKLSINDFNLFENSDYIIHTAGAQNKPNSSRLDVLEENVKITKDVFSNRTFKDAVKLIIVSNPVDIISYYTWKYSGLKQEQIIGTGTFLDSNRLNHYIANTLNCPPHEVNSYVLGEHGDSQFAAYSMSKIGDELILSKKEIGEEQLQVWEKHARNAAYEIRKTQASTHYGVAQCVDAIFNDLNSEQIKRYPLSVLSNDFYNTYLKLEHPIFVSLPVEISKKGVRIMNYIDFTEHELNAFKKSAKIISDLIHSK